MRKSPNSQKIFSDNKNKLQSNNNKKSLHFFTNNFFLKSGSGWILRLYYKVADDSPVMRDLCELACREPFFDLCDVEHNPRLGNASVLYPILWRFLPVIDVQVDLFLSRDLDSRINPREVSNIRIHRQKWHTYTRFYELKLSQIC